MLLSDLWEPLEQTGTLIDRLSAQGLHGHVVQIVDPAEESFPYSGRIEFHEEEAGASIIAPRAETWRQDYQARLTRHREGLRYATLSHGWTFTIHRTDRSPADLLLALHARMGAGREGTSSYRAAVAPAEESV